MRTLVAVALVLAALVVGGSAQAATWPANCHDWTCVNNHLNNLNQRAKAQRVQTLLVNNRLGQLENHWVLQCLYYGYVGLGQFSDYAASPSGTTTGLDYATSPDFWVPIVKPSCTPPAGTSPRSHRSFAPSIFQFHTKW